MMLLGLEFPDHLHYAIEPQTWARVENDGTVTVGITALGVHLSGEIYFCRPKSVGQDIECGRSIAVVELAKSIVSVQSPVAGRVVAINERLAQAPEWVHTDPYGNGWLARLQPSDLAGDLTLLIHGEAVSTAMREHARLHQIE